MINAIVGKSKEPYLTVGSPSIILFSWVRGTYWTNGCASSAVDALLGVNNVDISLTNSINWTLCLTGAASDAVMIDFISHDFHLPSPTLAKWQQPSLHQSYYT